MKIVQMVFLMVVFVSIEIYSQWEWIHPKPQGNTLNSIESVDSTNLITVGNNGTILRTTDGGNNWELINSGLTNNLNSVYIVDRQHIWICGNDGTILKSTDGGKNWDNQETNTVLNLNSIFFIDNLDGYCGGGYFDINNHTKSILLHTTNGGKNWEQVNLNNSYPINKIDFINHNIGYLCGGIPSSHGYVNTAFFLKTTDGGIKWEKQSFNASDFKSLFFINENYGFLITEFGSFYKTTDGGSKWELGKISGDEGNYLNDIYFEDESNGWIVGGGNGWGGRIFHTSDGGKDWHTQTEWGAGAYTGFNDLVFLNSNQLFLVGIDGDIRKTTDGGNSWNILTKRYFTNTYPPFFLNSMVGWIATSSYIYHTSDRGLTWQWTSNSKGVYHPKFNNESFGYSINLNKITITTDGGKNWNQFTINSPGYIITLEHIYQWDKMHGVVWCDRMETFMGGQDQIAYVTSNGWASYSPYFNLEMISDVVASSNYAWAVNGSGLLFKTSNYGKSWQKINTGYSQNFIKISVPDTNNLWILGSNLLIRSTDGGTKWEKVYTPNMPPSYYYQDFHFVSTGNGCILANLPGSWDYKVYYTLDSGNTWDSLNLNLESNINGITFTNDNYILAYGSNGKIVAYNIVIHATNRTNATPIEFTLLQNYPNPFNPSTRIEYSIPKAENVTLKIYDILGRQIATLVNEEKPVGNYSVEFNGSNLPSGVYFYQIKAGDYIKTKKMLLLK